jgi:hydrogenase nickel incorporation protein HypA/HybF
MAPMHELSLMEAVREQVLEQARRHGAHRIDVITLRIGSLAGVEPEALQFACEVVMAGSIAANARLQIEPVPAAAFCDRCQGEFTLGDGLWECPRCGGLSRQLRRGRELQLASLQLT